LRRLQVCADGKIRQSSNWRSGYRPINGHPSGYCWHTMRPHRARVHFNDFEHPNSLEKARPYGILAAASEFILVQTLYSASVLAVLKLFGYDAEKPDGGKVHSLLDVMTMEYHMNYWFDRLEL
jgi:hypothetical protein